MKSILLATAILPFLNGDSAATLNTFNSRIVPNYKTRAEAVEGARALAVEFRDVANGVKAHRYVNPMLISADLRARYSIVRQKQNLSDGFEPIRLYMENRAYEMAEHATDELIYRALNDVTTVLERIE